MDNAPALLALACVLDMLIGDPPFRFHPVRLIGNAAKGIERAFFRVGLCGYLGGMLFYVLVVATCLSIFGIVRFGCLMVHPGVALAFDVMMLYASFALTDLKDHAKPVWQALERRDLDAARTAVQQIVGRDAALLDAHGVGRAAVESIAESFVDAFLSPLFFFTIGVLSAPILRVDPGLAGVCAAFVYRITNTLDSMVGYKNDTYRRFGFWSAKTDDLLNFAPARLSIVFYFFAALLLGLSPIAGLRTASRDRKKSPSPNAAHAESVVAGALGVSLGGPVAYPFGVVDKPWIGRGERGVGPTAIRRCWRLTATAAGVTVCAVILVLTI